MKPRRFLEIHGDETSQSVAVGWSNSEYAIAWFWHNPGMNALKNAKDYVRWMERKRKR